MAWRGSFLTSVAICMGVAGLADMSRAPAASLRDAPRGAASEVMPAFDPGSAPTGRPTGTAPSVNGAQQGVADDGSGGQVPQPAWNGAIGTALIALGDLHMKGRIDRASGEMAFDLYAELLTQGAQVASVVQPDRLVTVAAPGAFPPDPAMARRAYLKAASLGRADAYLRLSDWYRDGAGGSRDDGKAHEYLERAVAAGDRSALVKLSLDVIERNEDAQDVIAAFSSLDALARQGNANAQYELGRLLMTRTEPGRPPDHDRAISLVQRAAKSGHAAAALLLARMQVFGTEVPRSPTTGLLALQELSDAGFADAMLALGDVFRGGVDSTLAADPARAYRYYTQAAEAGSDSARIRMAEMLLGGEGVARDVMRALAMLEQGAGAGNIAALVELGALYRDGGVDGVDRDPRRALGYLRRASELGDRRASLEAALIQLSGPEGVADPETALASLEVLATAGDGDAAFHLAAYHADAGDPERAFGYYTQAAEAGSDSARTRMAEMLLGGEGVARDVARALAMLEQGAQAGSTSALLALGIAYRDGEGVDADLRRALGYLRRGADLGDRRASLEAALIELTGPGDIADPEAALARLEVLAAAGDGAAAFHLAEYHADAGDPERAFGYYTQAAEAGSDSARTRMAGMLMTGAGVERDVPRALAMLEQGAQAGSSTALLALGDAYARGQTGRVDIDASLAAYEAAANLGNAAALVRLADIYRYGLLSTTSKAQAFGYLERAADQGNAYAEYMMGQALVDGDVAGAGTMAKGIDLLVRADRSGIADAATALALLDRGVPEGRFTATGKLGRLRELAALGNVAASLKLVEAYRDGRGGRGTGRGTGLTARDLVLARKELDMISGRIDPAEYEVQSLLIDLRTARGPDFRALFERIKRLPRGERPGAMRRVLELDANAFVYFVQFQLARDGYYTGNANGLMTSRTIAAVQGLCDALQADRLCRHGPLSPQVYTLLFYAF